MLIPNRGGNRCRDLVGIQIAEEMVSPVDDRELDLPVIGERRTLLDEAADYLLLGPMATAVAGLWWSTTSSLRGPGLHAAMSFASRFHE